MIFRLTNVERSMLLPPNVKTDAETAQIVRNGFLIAHDDKYLMSIQKAVTVKADAFYAMQMFEESRRYMELAMRVRDMRTALAKGQQKPLYKVYEPEGVIVS